MLTTVTIVALAIAVALAVTTISNRLRERKAEIEKLTGEMRQLREELQQLQGLANRAINRNRAHYDFLKVAHKRVWALYQAVHKAGLDDISRGVLDKQFGDETPLFGRQETTTEK